MRISIVSHAGGACTIVILTVSRNVQTVNFFFTDRYLLLSQGVRIAVSTSLAASPVEVVGHV
jgi:hypothetical protein